LEITTVAYVLILIIFGGGPAVIHEPARVGHFHSLENCQAAAGEARPMGIDRAAFAFICVRENDLPVVHTR
jgi:hypothetical protein